jgi:hypothetical protein
MATTRLSPPAIAQIVVQALAGVFYGQQPSEGKSNELRT